MHPWFHRIGITGGLAVGVAVASCSGAGGSDMAPNCSPSTMRTCSCTDGDEGVQECSKERNYEPCLCLGKADAGGHEDSGGDRHDAAGVKHDAGHEKDSETQDGEAEDGGIDVDGEAEDAAGEMDVETKKDAEAKKDGAAKKDGEADDAQAKKDGEAKDSEPVDAACSCQSGQVCDQWGDCLDPKIIDNFEGSSCDTAGLAIPEISNRIGYWYDYSSPEVFQQFGISSPGPTWADTGCAAWTTGSDVAGASPGDYAGIGIAPNDGSTYSLLAYTGITVQIETSMPVTFFLELLNGYEFATTLPGATGAVKYNIPFADLVPFTAAGTPAAAVIDLTQVSDITFAATNVSSTSFGYAVHLVALY